jgi:hypothetical protein
LFLIPGIILSIELGKAMPVRHHNCCLTGQT